MEVVLTPEQRKKLQHAADIRHIQMLVAHFVTAVSKMDVSDVFETMYAQGENDVSIELCDSGKYIGPDQVRSFLAAYDGYLKKPDDKTGWMEAEHLCTPYVIIDPNGEKAMANWSVLSPCAKRAYPYPGDVEMLTAYWLCGKYHCSFKKVGQEWKFTNIHKIAYARSPFELGWMKQGDCDAMPALEGVMPDQEPTCYSYNAHLISAKGGREWGPYLPDEKDFV